MTSWPCDSRPLYSGLTSLHNATSDNILVVNYESVTVSRSFQLVYGKLQDVYDTCIRIRNYPLTSKFNDIQQRARYTWAQSSQLHTIEGQVCSQCQRKKPLLSKIDTRTKQRSTHVRNNDRHTYETTIDTRTKQRSTYVRNNDQYMTGETGTRLNLTRNLQITQ